MGTDLIKREHNGVLILQREDGYLNLTAMCKANGKLFADYWRLASTQEFAAALAADMGIPISSLIQVQRGGRREVQGSWGHHRIAIHAAMWCNPIFAVKVTGWVEEIGTKGYVDLRPQQAPQLPPEQLCQVIAATCASTIGQAIAPLTQAMAQLIGMLGAVPSKMGPLITVEDRITQRWPLATAKQRRRIRDRALARLSQQRGKVPIKLGGSMNSTYGFEQTDLDVLDDAIDLVKEAAERQQFLPLIDRTKPAQQEGA